MKDSDKEKQYYRNELAKFKEQGKHRYHFEPILDFAIDYKLQLEIVNEITKEFEEIKKDKIYPITKDSILLISKQKKQLYDLFNKEYVSLLMNKQYFLGCPISTYTDTYKTRLEDFKGNLTDSEEIDFVKYELNQSFRVTEYFAQTQIELNIKISLDKRNDFLEERSRELGYKAIHNTDTGLYTISKQNTKNEPSKDDTHSLDLSDTIPIDKIRYLHELGIIDYLRKTEPFSTSTNRLATVISAFTGIDKTTVQSYINPMINDDVRQSNNPLNNINKMDKVKNKLIEIGFKPLK